MQGCVSLLFAFHCDLLLNDHFLVLHQLQLSVWKCAAMLRITLCGVGPYDLCKVRFSKAVSLTRSSLWNRKIKLITYQYFSLKRLCRRGLNSPRTCQLWSSAKTRFPTRCSLMRSISSLFFPLSAVVALPSSALYCTESFDVGFGWGHCRAESQRRSRPLSSQAVSFLRLFWWLLACLRWC